MMNLNALGEERPFPILGIELNDENSAYLDLSESHLNEIGMNPNHQDTMRDYIFGACKYRYGGYLEQRSMYRDTALFSKDNCPRDIHLGIDYWAVAAHSVYCPWDSMVVSAENNEGEGNYGPTLILSHQLEQGTIYSLYGHLDLDVLAHKPGSRIRAGSVLGHLGSPQVNGGWLPHVHLQIITDLGDYTGDFPGVCSDADLSYYRDICPDPNGYGL
jgi:hypothetical protein